MQDSTNQECHAECSSVARKHTQQLEPSVQTTVHDIFLSHSGKQKGFAKDLRKVLCPIYSTFFDEEQDSLPAGQHFPSKIFKAAETCKMAVVVLSEDFMSSKWPMIELCIFADRHPNISILPLFYKLQPGDLKLEQNLKRWEEKWKGYAEEGREYSHSLTVANCFQALTILRSVSGLVHNPSQGVLGYLDKIKSTISGMVNNTITLDGHLLYGKDRLCKVILDTFEDMEQHLEHSKALVVGLIGPAESGKSTLGLLLRDHFSRQYANKVRYLKLRDSTTEDELLKIFKELLDLTDFQNNVNLDKISELRDVISLLKTYNLPGSSVCLVIDNVHEHSITAVKEILELGVGHGSKVILVSQSHDVLKPVHRMGGDRYLFKCVSMPNLIEPEARELFLHYVGAQLGLDKCAIEDCLTDKHRDIALGIVRTCGLVLGDSLSYLPGAVKKIAEEVVAEGHEHELTKLLEGQVNSRIKDCSLQGVREFVLDSFNALPDDEHRILFLDIALIILPSNIQSKKRAYEILSSMHECSRQELEEKIKVLEVYDFVKKSSWEAGLSIYAVHAQFADAFFETRAWKNIKHVLVESPRMSLREMWEDAVAHRYVRNGKSVELVKFKGASYLIWCGRRLICPSSCYCIGVPMDVSFTGQDATMRWDYKGQIISIITSFVSSGIEFIEIEDQGPGSDDAGGRKRKRHAIPGGSWRGWDAALSDSVFEGWRGWDAALSDSVVLRIPVFFGLLASAMTGSYNSKATTLPTLPVITTLIIVKLPRYSPCFLSFQVHLLEVDVATTMHFLEPRVTPASA